MDVRAVPQRSPTQMKGLQFGKMSNTMEALNIACEMWTLILWHGSLRAILAPPATMLTSATLLPRPKIMQVQHCIGGSGGCKCPTEQACIISQHLQHLQPMFGITTASPTFPASPGARDYNSATFRPQNSKSMFLHKKRCAICLSGPPTLTQFTLQQQSCYVLFFLKPEIRNARGRHHLQHRKSEPLLVRAECGSAKCEASRHKMAWLKQMCDGTLLSGNQH